MQCCNPISRHVFAERDIVQSRIIAVTLQDPSYDPYGFAKVATRAASSEGGSAAACPANVQKFFQTILSLGASASGRKTINTEMSLCSDSTLASSDDIENLALYVQDQWTTAVSKLVNLSQQ